MAQIDKIEVEHTDLNETVKYVRNVTNKLIDLQIKYNDITTQFLQMHEMFSKSSFFYKDPNYYEKSN